MLAKNGEQEVLLKYYGEANLGDRVIATGFGKIADVKLGKKEKLLYVADQESDILAEYYIPEIKCPKAMLVTGCNDYFMDQDIKCQHEEEEFFHEIERMCVCRAGFFREVESGRCKKCSCSRFYQICS